MSAPVTPVFASKSFSCAHCGAHSDQTWYSGHARGFGNDEHPHLISKEFANKYALAKTNRDASDENYKWLKDYFLKASNGELFLEKFESHYTSQVANVNYSKCYSCQQLTVWYGDKILFPPSRYIVEPNEDLPPEMKLDFNEARSILDLSPRGAAAILRLVVQKLCKFLDKPGKNIDEDIASLVKDGLDVRVQKALDIVRVVGNEAVHPGQMDLKDDRETAAKLFALVNRITYDTITHPKELEKLYTELPETKLRAIERRDA
jgi:hypothetical protein